MPDAYKMPMSVPSLENVYGQTIRCETETPMTKYLKSQDIIFNTILLATHNSQDIFILYEDFKTLRTTVTLLQVNPSDAQATTLHQNLKVLIDTIGMLFDVKMG